MLVFQFSSDFSFPQKLSQVQREEHMQFRENMTHKQASGTGYSEAEK